MSEFQLRKSIPIIGYDHTEKYDFLKNLLSSNILRNDALDKIVCIIRHNKDLEEPKFYHIKYDNYKGKEYNKATIDDDFIEGYDKIKQKLKEIDDDNSELIDNRRIDYTEIFYVLELNINSINNDELLNNYDFYSIPILDEYDNDIYENIFKFLNNNIDFNVFILNVDWGNVASVNKIVSPIGKIYKPNKIENSLIILNRENIKPCSNSVLYTTKILLLKDLVDYMNLQDNTFIMVDQRKMKHNGLLNQNFEDYLIALFNDYLSEPLIIFKDGKIHDNKYPKFDTNIDSFYKFLYNFIFKENMNDKEKEEYLNQLIDKFDKEGYDFKQFGLEEILQKIINSKDYEIEFDIDIKEEKSIKLFKALYIIFKDQIKMPKEGQFKKKINDYFNNISENIKNKKSKNNNKIILNQNDDLNNSGFLNKFEKIIKNIKLENLKSEKLTEGLCSLYNAIFYIQQYYYIGILGSIGTGKSVLLNTIAGFDIFPVDPSGSLEKGKRGIILEDGVEFALYRAKSEIKNVFKESNFVNFKKLDKIISGEKNVKEYLKILNSKYFGNTKVENFDFFIVTLPIKFFSEMKIEENVKNNIKFIYLPDNCFDTSLFDKIINSISLFIYNYTPDTIDTENYFEKNYLNKIKFDQFNSKGICVKKNIPKIFLNLNLIDDRESKTKEFREKLLKNLQNETKFGYDLTHIYSILINIYKKYEANDAISIIDECLERYKKIIFIESSFFEFILNMLSFEIIYLYVVDVDEIISEGKYDSDMHEKISNYFKNYPRITKTAKNLEEELKKISTCFTYIYNNLNKLEKKQYNYSIKFFKDLAFEIYSNDDKKNDIIENAYKTCKNNFLYFYESKYEENNIMNLKNYWDSFYSLFQEYNNDLSISNNNKEINEFLDKIYIYAKTRQQVRAFSKGPTHGTCKELNWTNGILEESENPKIYMKKFEKKCDGKPFQKITLDMDEKFEDIIVGWRIESKWQDGTNGEWFMKNNPLDTKNFKCKFTTKLFRGERFNVYIYLMVYPEMKHLSSN